MHDDSVLLERRIRRELGERLMPAMYTDLIPMRVTAWEAPGEPVAFDEAVEALAREGQPLSVGTHFGRPWGTTWLHLVVEVPEAWAAADVEAVIDLGFHPDSAGFQSEGLVWRDGVPLQGIHPRRTAFALDEVRGGRLELFVEAASNPAFPMRVGGRNMGSLRTAGDAPIYRLRQASLGLRSADVFHLLLDVEVLLGLMAALPASSPRRQRLLRQLTSAFDLVDLTSASTIASTAPSARAALAPALARRNGDSAHRVVGVGHAHIDSAWLWPMRETVRKCARTFASAVRMIDTYPEFRFVCSQAAQYEWMATQYPALFEKIRDRVASGGWQPVGGMWVEADMNLPSGESIVRQMVHGQRWFDEQFGRRCAEVWIPDVFGYPASLPQIFRAGGAARFVTQKLSWNKQNRFPHHTFWWTGLDGSRVLTHFPPVDTYNAMVTGEEMVASEQNFKEHGWSDWSLMPFGHGNGGGGPTREMIERSRRFVDLEGAPRLTLGTTDEFFERVESEVAAGAPVPVWDGELYFEMHRGTLTSQTRTKVGNRRCERLLREAELWWATATRCGVVSPTAERETAAALDRLWKDVLVQQFHDILPGSSITWVHEDAEREHERIALRLESLVSEALSALAPGPTVANAGAFARLEVVPVTADTVASGAVGASAGQRLHDGSVAVAVNAAGLATSPLVVAAIDDRVTVTEHSFANSSVAVHWSLDGAITSIIDVRAGRELLPEGRTVSVWLAPDHPVEYDAWDLEAWTRGLGREIGREVGTVESIEVVDAGPLVATLRVRRSFGRSTMVQDLTVRAGSPRVDLSFDIEWHEDEQLLTLDVPLAVRTREAACGIQYGHVMRPTHASTSWDAAKFEVCAHRWVDLSEADWGVAVLDDGRWGHGLHDGGVTVSLLRAAKYPDPEQDHGRHTVTVSVLPHAAGLGSVVREAEALNVPLRVIGTGAGVAADDSWAVRVVHADHHAVDVSAVKLADDGSGDLVVRLAEVTGARTPVTAALSRRIESASRCNALEEPQQPLDVADGIVSLTLQPFELVTLRLAD
ncbi:MAG: alpha-mannosidase [Ilumatobacteraceae bacterium]